MNHYFRHGRHLLESETIHNTYNVPLSTINRVFVKVHIGGQLLISKKWAQSVEKLEKELDGKKRSSGRDLPRQAVVFAAAMLYN
jgi:hypothetical protein